MAKYPRFRIWSTIWWGYRYAFQNPKLLIRCSAFFLPMMFIMFGIGPTYLVLVLNAELSDFGNSLTRVTSVIILFCLAHFAVAWHRSVLVNDRSPRFLRFGSLEIKYFIITLGAWLLEELAFSLYFLDPSFGFISDQTILETDVIVQIVALFGLPIVGLIVYCLLPIILPAVSIKDTKMSVDIAWNNMKGWRLRFMVFWLVETTFWMLPFIGVSNLLHLLRVPIWNQLGLNSEEKKSLLDIFLAMFVETMMAIPSVIILVVSTGGMLAGLSIAYAGLARHAHKKDKNYKPIPVFSERLSS